MIVHGLQPVKCCINYRANVLYRASSMRGELAIYFHADL